MIIIIIIIIIVIIDTDMTKNKLERSQRHISEPLTLLVTRPIIWMSLGLNLSRNDGSLILMD